MFLITVCNQGPVLLVSSSITPVKLTTDTRSARETYNHQIDHMISLLCVSPW